MTLTLLTSRSVQVNERRPIRPRRTILGRVLALAGGCIAALAVAVPASPATFAGVLRDRDGVPVADQDVRLQSSTGFLQVASTTGADGRFSVSVSPGSYQLGVGRCMMCGPRGEPNLPDSYGLFGPSIELAADREQDLTLRNLFLTVRVLDPAGQPVAGATVAAQGQAGFDLFAGGGTFGGASSSAVTGDDGRARLPLLQTPAPLGLPTPGMPGFAPITLTITPPAGSGLLPFSETVSELTSDTAITVPRGAVARDTTEPVIEPHIIGTIGTDGWYTSDITVSWAVSDPESGIAASTGCETRTIATDTISTTLTCSATNGAGLEAEHPITVKRDATSPAITHTLTPESPDGSNGWYISRPTVRFHCDDATSGIAGCLADGETDAAKSVDERATPQLVRGTAVDDAGNTSRDSASGLRVDLSDPIVTCTGAPTFLQGQTGTQVSATVTDAISGPQAASVATAAATDQVGSLTAQLTGRDNAGRSTTVACPYNVIYRWTGFFKPVDNPPTLNAARAGSAVPMKFSLNGQHGTSIIATGYPQSRQIRCDAAASIDDVEETATAGSSGLSYDAASDTYTYVWKTDSSWSATCRQLILKLADATTHSANFTFK